MKYIAYGVAPDQADEDLLFSLQNAAPDYTIVTGRTKKELKPYLSGIEIAFRDIENDALGAMPKLKWFQAWSAGIDHLLKDKNLQKSSFQISSASGIHPVPMAEHIFSLLLTLGRGLLHADQFRRNHEFGKVAPEKLFELDGKNMLILGAGAIGRRTATLARAFGMRVTAAKRRNLDRLGPFDQVIPWESFREYLESSDIVLNILPLTPDTENLFTAAEFKRMRTDSIFVNVGRGKTVVQEALEDALLSGTIGGACLDVTDPEPLPSASPLWEMDNVVLTGHYAGFTPRYEERGNKLFLKNLELYLQGKTPENIVDRERGY